VNQSTAQLILSPDARTTCCRCEHEVALADGFAKKAFEGVEAASSQELAALREREGVSAEHQAQRIAPERDAAHETA